MDLYCIRSDASGVYFAAKVMLLNYCEAMKYIEGFSKLGKPVANLSRFERIMNALGDPQKEMNFVHVAGTNGKGSTVRMIAETLTKAGYRTGEFTSPYIRVYNDRIRIDGANIADEELAEIVTQIKPILDGLTEGCSQFEITTAIAFIYFKAKKCGIVVLETGLGGLLDCTNIIEKPCVSVITSISPDHTAILGDTLEQIALHKAGIIKQGCPVVISPSQSKEAYAVVYRTAARFEAKLVTPDMDRLKIKSCGYTGNSFYYRGLPYKTSMVGRHQIDNALTALETLRVLKRRGFGRIFYPRVYKGLKEASVPSRCQTIRADKPFVMMDGAHNPDGMRALADFVRTVPKAPKILVCGMMADKDWRASIGYISRYIDRAVCLDGFARNTVSARELAGMFTEGEISNLRDAASRAVTLAGTDGMVIIAGSLYLAAALQTHGGLENIADENEEK
ncbi:MAG: bifunctional folylpolyglutamate synthase/dihydrofolate synthase [Prevotella sp.]|nr:bifunctional folylpolyglutamate synthase/dihydrofolate synthase [Prevotella sp.]